MKTPDTDTDWMLDFMSRVVDEAVFPAVVEEVERGLTTVGGVPRSRSEAYTAAASFWNYLLHHPIDLARLNDFVGSLAGAGSGPIREGRDG